MIPEKYVHCVCMFFLFCFDKTSISAQMGQVIPFGEVVKKQDIGDD